MKLSTAGRVAMVVAALALIITLKTPIWWIWMWAPQYPEGLNLYIWVNDISGDVEIINGLNHYIGMKHIKVEMFPEFAIMPALVGFIMVAGLTTAAVGRRWILWGFLTMFVIIGISGMVDFWLWGYDYGHNLDPTAAIKVPGMAYQPPLIGTKELLNFIAYSAPDIGGWAFITTGVLTVGALALDILRNKD
jgi:copper chaperone NosL